MRRSAALLAGLSLAGGALLGGCTGGSDADPTRAGIAGRPRRDRADVARPARLQRGVRRQPGHRRGAGRPRRRRGRRPGVLQPAPGDRRGGRLPVLRRRPADPVEVPDPRAVRRGRSLLLHRGPAGRGRRADQHAPRLRPGRAEPARPRRTGRRRARHRGRGPALVDREAAPLGRPVCWTTAGRCCSPGDLNQPSHLDWTAATAAEHGGVGPVAWPVSEALADAGLRDAYREAHPDPVADPGNTWGGVAGSGGSPRRIDYAYVGGPVEVESSEVVGEQGGDSVDRGYPRWTSDHRAVLSTADRRRRPRSRPPSPCRAAWSPSATT